MKGRGTDAAGFSLVEVVIAMLLLGLLAVSLLPVLWQGIRFSNEQALVATATRQLNAHVEVARDDEKCASLLAVSAPTRYSDGAIETDLLSSYEFETTGSFSCVDGASGLIEGEFTATREDGSIVASVTAKIWVSQ